MGIDSTDELTCRFLNLTFIYPRSICKTFPLFPRTQLRPDNMRSYQSKPPTKDANDEIFTKKPTFILLILAILFLDSLFHRRIRWLRNLNRLKK